MPRPTETTPTSVFPTFATSGTGIANTVYPGATKQGDGWAASERPPASWFNWFFNSVGQWLGYVNQYRAVSLWDQERLEAETKANAIVGGAKSGVISISGAYTSSVPRRTILVSGVDGADVATHGTQQACVVVYDNVGVTGIQAGAYGGSDSPVGLGSPTGLTGAATEYIAKDMAHQLSETGTRGCALIYSATSTSAALIRYEVDSVTGAVTQFHETGLQTAYVSATDGANCVVASTTGRVLTAASPGTDKEWWVATAQRIIRVQNGTGSGAAHSIPSVPRAIHQRVNPTGAGYTACIVTDNGSIYRASNYGAWTQVFVSATPGLVPAALAGNSLITCDEAGTWIALTPNSGGTTYQMLVSGNDGLNWTPVSLGAASQSYMFGATIHNVGRDVFIVASSYQGFVAVRVESPISGANTRLHGIGYPVFGTNLIPASTRITNGKFVTLGSGADFTFVTSSPVTFEVY